MIALRRAIRALPHIDGTLAIKVLADEVAAGRGDTTRSRSVAQAA